jgi:hypothetical protein
LVSLWFFTSKTPISVNKYQLIFHKKNPPLLSPLSMIKTEHKKCAVKPNINEKITHPVITVWIDVQPKKPSGSASKKEHHTV